MAGYHIYSLDWGKFRGFADAPTRPQLLAFAGLVSDGLDTCDCSFKDDDPLRDWPSEPEELCTLLEPRLRQPDWYGDLSDIGKSLWAGAVSKFCDDARPKDVKFRVESDGIYWDVIEIAYRHHGLPGRITGAILSHFGTRPYRYFQPPDYIPSLRSWMPYHSMHTPEEVRAFLEELKEAAPSILASGDEGARRDYEEELLPVVEKVARAGRMLYIAVDT